jgi:hypothetical protein
VTNNGTDFIESEYPNMNTPGVYYKEAMKEIDNFWSGNQGMGMREPYFNEVDELVEETVNSVGGIQDELELLKTRGLVSSKKE